MPIAKAPKKKKVKAPKAAPAPAAVVEVVEEKAPEPVKKKVVVPKKKLTGRDLSGISKSEYNKIKAEEAKEAKDAQQAQAKARRDKAEAIALAKMGVGKVVKAGGKEVEDLDEDDKPKVVSRAVAKALGIPKGDKMLPKEVLELALKKMPGVDAGDGLPKEQLLMLAAELTARKAVKAAKAAEKQAKKDAAAAEKEAARQAVAAEKVKAAEEKAIIEAEEMAAAAALRALDTEDVHSDFVFNAGVTLEPEPDEVLDAKAMKALAKKKKISKRKDKRKKKKEADDEEVIGADGIAVGEVQAGLAKLRAVTGVLGSKMTDADVKIDKYSMAFAGPILINDCSFELSQGTRYGLIGDNGSGKTNFINSIACREVPIPDHIDMYHLHQEADPTERTAVESLVDHVKEEVAKLEKLSDEIIEENGPEDERLFSIGERLDELDPANFETNARKVLSGLGFEDHVVPMDRKTKHMSGGWRMRVSLGKALFAAPSILLLDEPTNHLDLEACIWLEEHLAEYSKCLLVVSHSQDFLNAVCNKIIWLERKLLTTYTGNYSMFLKLTEQELKVQQRAYEKQQMDIAKLTDYIAKNKANKKTVKSAQSKEKVLMKIMAEAVERPKDQGPSLNFRFLECHRLASPVLPFDQVTFCYSGNLKDGSDILYKDLEIGVDCDSRIALVGPNGSGKSTLLKLMAGELTPTKGSVSRKQGMILGRYNQHSAETLNMSMSPLDFFKHEFPTERLKKMGGGEMTDSMWRAFLGNMGINGSLQTSKIGALSDGQKARLILGKIRMVRPNILLLDEPTNHLDVNAIDGLAASIKAFDGGVVLVSHDFRLIDQVANLIWECTGPRAGATIKVWPGTIQEYKGKLAKKMQKYKVKAEKTAKKIPSRKK